MVLILKEVSVRRLSFLVLTLAVCGCDSPTEPDPQISGELITVDAAVAPVYVRLGNQAQVVSPADPRNSADWDLALFATSVTVNGGAAGPGGVSAGCLCRGEPSVADLQRMTATSELARFDSVTAARIPAGTEFRLDELAPVISGWFSGNATAGTVAAVPTRSFLIREGSSSPVFSKFRVTSIAGATAGSPGQVTVEFAVQPSAGAGFGAVRSAVVSVGSTRTYFDLSSGAITDASNWDIAFEGYAIRVNGGVSGNGSVGAVRVETMGFMDITAAVAGSVPPAVYAGDTFAGTFGVKPWYRYNITGTDNQIWPTYDVYLIRRGSELYKVQLIGYYDQTGRSRQITLRYARLSP